MVSALDRDWEHLAETFTLGASYFCTLLPKVPSCSKVPPKWLFHEEEEEQLICIKTRSLSSCQALS